jgi:hypothetical protein
MLEMSPLNQVRIVYSFLYVLDFFYFTPATVFYRTSDSNFGDLLEISFGSILSKKKSESLYPIVNPWWFVGETLHLCRLNSFC